MQKIKQRYKVSKHIVFVNLCLIHYFLFESSNIPHHMYRINMTHVWKKEIS